MSMLNDSPMTASPHFRIGAPKPHMETVLPLSANPVSDMLAPSAWAAGPEASPMAITPMATITTLRATTAKSAAARERILPDMSIPSN